MNTMKTAYLSPHCETYALVVEGSLLNDISNGSVINPPVLNSIFQEEQW